MYVHISCTLFADWQINTLIYTVHNLEQKRGKIVLWIICSLSQKWDLEKWPEGRYRIRTGVYTLTILFIIFTPLNINVLECLLYRKVNKKAYQSNKLKQKIIFSFIFTYIYKNWLCNYLIISAKQWVSVVYICWNGQKLIFAKMKNFSTFYKLLIFKGLRQALARGRSILKQKLKSLSITKIFFAKVLEFENSVLL